MADPRPRSPGRPPTPTAPAEAPPGAVPDAEPAREPAPDASRRRSSAKVFVAAADDLEAGPDPAAPSALAARRHSALRRVAVGAADADLEQPEVLTPKVGAGPAHNEPADGEEQPQTAGERGWAKIRASRGRIASIASIASLLSQSRQRRHAAAETLSSTELFEGLDDLYVKRMKEQLRVARFERGARLTTAGESASEFFIVSSGKVRLREPRDVENPRDQKQDEKDDDDELPPSASVAGSPRTSETEGDDGDGNGDDDVVLAGGMVGHHALLFERPHQHTAVALCDVTVMRMSAQQFREVMGSFLSELRRRVRTREALSDLPMIAALPYGQRSVLCNALLPIVSNLSGEEQSLVCHALSMGYYKAGDVISPYGDRSGVLCIVAEGEVGCFEPQLSSLQMQTRRLSRFGSSGTSMSGSSGSMGSGSGLPTEPTTPTDTEAPPSKPQPQQLQQHSPKGAKRSPMRRGSGSASIDLDNPTHVLTAGALFGKRELLWNERCPETRVARGAVQLRMLTRAAFQTFPKNLQDVIRANLFVRDSLQHFPFFRLLETRDQREVFRRMELVDFADGEHILRAGDPPDSLFVVARGRAMVLVPPGESAHDLGAGYAPEGSGHLVDFVSQGDVVGERGVVYRQPRNANIVAAGHAKLWCLHFDMLQQALEPEQLDKIRHVLRETVVLREKLYDAQSNETFLRGEKARKVSVLRRVREKSLSTTGLRRVVMYSLFIGWEVLDLLTDWLFFLVSVVHSASDDLVSIFVLCLLVSSVASMVCVVLRFKQIELAVSSREHITSLVLETMQGENEDMEHKYEVRQRLVLRRWSIIIACLMMICEDLPFLSVNIFLNKDDLFESGPFSLFWVDALALCFSSGALCYKSWMLTRYRRATRELGRVEHEIDTVFRQRGVRRASGVGDLKFFVDGRVETVKADAIKSFPPGRWQQYVLDFDHYFQLRERDSPQERYQLVTLTKPKRDRGLEGLMRTLRRGGSESVRSPRTSGGSAGGVEPRSMREVT